MEAVKVDPQKSIPIRNWKAQDWIDHASFGVGQVSESRGDKLDIDFVNGGRKTLLKSTELNQAVAPRRWFQVSSRQKQTSLRTIEGEKPTETVAE
jgi:hypothetical protein